MIFINELIKAFCKRTTIAIFAVLLILTRRFAVYKRDKIDA